MRVLFAAAVLCVRMAAAEDFAREAGAAREANQVAAAIELYRKAVSANPQWTEGWWYLGTLLYDSDDYAGAAPAFQKAAALNPKSGATLVMLGLSEARLQHSADALRDLKSGRDLGIPDDPQLRHVMLYTLATLWLDRGGERGDFENAQDALDALARDGVASDDLTLSLGRAVLRTHPPDGDEALLRQAGAAEILAAQRGRLTEALAAYERLAASAPRVPNVQFAFGKFLLANSYDERAVTAFQCELQNSPNHLLARLGLAGVKIASDPAGALPFAAAAVKLAPDLPEAHYLLGMSLLGVGQIAPAVGELETARHQAPNQAKIPFALARAYARAKRPADAARARAAFLRLQRPAEAAVAE